MADQAAQQIRRDRLTTLLDNLRQRSANVLDADLVRYVIVFIAGGLFVSAAAAILNVVDNNAAWSWLAGSEAFLTWLDGFAQNFSTEMIGVVITFILIEVLLTERRANQAKEIAEQEEKERLILQMGSPFNESAVEAARQLMARGWLKDGSLHGAHLDEANLEGASLWGANLPGASLWGANLPGAILTVANLQGADLRRAKLEGARLFEANLQGVDLDEANLEGALHLTVEQLRSAETLKDSTLPDGHRLPNDNTWQQAFEHWVEHTAQLKEIDTLLGELTYIVPTRTEANAKRWDEYYRDGR